MTEPTEHLFVSIHSATRLGDNREAHAFALTEHAKLFSKGWTSVLSITGQEEAIIARIGPLLGSESEVAGVIVFAADEEENTYWVALTAIHERFRGKGIYKKMWDSLLFKAIANDKVSIDGGTHVDNIPMQKAAESVGRKLNFYYYTFDIQAEKDRIQAEKDPIQAVAGIQTDRRKRRRFISTSGDPK